MTGNNLGRAPSTARLKTRRTFESIRLVLIPTLVTSTSEVLRSMFAHESLVRPCSRVRAAGPSRYHLWGGVDVPNGTENLAKSLGI